MTTDSSDVASIEAAALLLSKLGVTPEDMLRAGSSSRTPRPTFATYIPQLLAAMPEGGTRKAYKSCWTRILDVPGWPDRPIDEPTTTDLEQLIGTSRNLRPIRSNDRGGRVAAQNTIAALRYLYRKAENDGHIPDGRSPARKLTRPRSRPSSRRAISSVILDEINQVAGRTGNDPELDTLLLRLHTETARRMCGALALRRMDLDPGQCLIRLREKGGSVRWQPVSPTLMRALLRHHEIRGGSPDERLLRYRNGKPMTRKRYEILWKRLREHVPQAAVHRFSTHWLRHTTMT